jgi:hypothetical protein
MRMNKHTGSADGYKYFSLDDHKNYFYTNDFSISVVLLLKGFELVTVTKEDERFGKFVFIFRQSTEINNLIKDYWLHRVSIDPLAYENFRKNLKSQMFALHKK